MNENMDLKNMDMKHRIIQIVQRSIFCATLLFSCGVAMGQTRKNVNSWDAINNEFKDNANCVLTLTQNIEHSKRTLIGSIISDGYTVTQKGNIVIDGANQYSITINTRATSSTHSGLISTMADNASLTLRNITIYLNCNISSTSDNIGVIVDNMGSGSQLTLENVTIKSTGAKRDVNATNNTGGVVGNAPANSSITLSNVTIDNFDVASRSLLGIRGDYAGGLVGKADGTLSITNCSVGQNMTVNGRNYIGGLVGSCATAVNFNGINLNGITVEGSETCVGGFIGLASSTLSLTNCSIANASIKATGDKVGGFAGESTGKVTFSTCNATSTTVDGASNRIGGFIGRGSGTISATDCNALQMTVKGSGNSNNKTRVGGFVGTTGGRFTATNCKFTGSVTQPNVSTSTSESDPVGRIGGFIGQAYGVTFRNCQVGEASTMATIQSRGRRIGGYVGTTEGANTLAFTNCKVYANISNDNTSYRVGGFVGYLTAGTSFDKDCLYSGGNITGSADIAAYVGKAENVSEVAFNGAKIKDGLTITCNSDKAGGYMGYAIGTTMTIKDVAVNNLTINGKTSSGVLIGVAEGEGVVTVSNAAVTNGRITSSGEQSGIVIGYSTAKTLAIENVSITNASVSGNKNNGGVAGKLEGAENSVYINNVKVQNSTISVDGSSNKDYNNIGGFVGLSNTNLTIQECEMSSGNVTATKSQSAGGLIGAIEGQVITSIYKCTSSAKIDTGIGYAGGIIGYDGHQGTNSLTQIISCSNSGNVDCQEARLTYGGVFNRTNYESEHSGAGGIIGSIRLGGAVSIVDCSNSGAIHNYNRQETNNSNRGAGGILGYAFDNSTATTINIANCSNTGSITGDAGLRNNIMCYTAGIVGYVNGNNARVTISESSNLGNVTGSSADITAGIIAYANNKTNIEWCYNRGQVRSGSAVAYGIAAKSVSGNVSYSYNTDYVGTNTLFAPNKDAQKHNYQLLPNANTQSDTKLSSLDASYFSSGHVAYALEMYRMTELAKQSLEPAEVHYIQDLAASDNYPSLAKEKKTVGGTECFAVDATGTWSIKDGGKYIREHVVYANTHNEDADTYTADVAKTTNSQCLTYSQSSYYSNIKLDGSIVKKGNTKIVIGNKLNNYIEAVSGAVDPTTVVNNTLFAIGTFANGVMNTTSYRGGTISLTDPNVMGNSSRSRCVPYNFYIPNDVTASNLNYVRSVSKGYFTLTIPFAVGRVTSNGADVTSKVKFGKLNRYDEENTDVDFVFKTITEWGGSVPAGAYLCEYIGEGDAVISMVSKDNKLTKSGWCPVEYGGVNSTNDDHFKDCYINTYKGGDDVALCGYTSRHISNFESGDGTKVWAGFYYFGSDDRFCGPATRGGSWVAPFRTLLFFSDYVGPASLEVKVRAFSEDGEVTEVNASMFDENNTLVNVFTLQGTKVRSGVRYGEALEGLAPGIYVVGGKKIIKR